MPHTAVAVYSRTSRRTIRRVTRVADGKRLAVSGGIQAMQVLIAEDDRVTGEILARTLNRWNYDTTVVNDGAKAWDHLRAATAILAVM